MTVPELQEKIITWDTQADQDSIAGSKYHSLFTELQYHSANRLDVFLPAEHVSYNSSFMERLAQWVGNCSCESDQRLLLEYSLYIAFITHLDFVSLYKTAYEREVKNWLSVVVQGNNPIQDINAFSQRIERLSRKHTWYCPVTDSLDINEFHKVNHLKGIGHRPTFSTLQMLANWPDSEDEKIAKNLGSYLRNPSQRKGENIPPVDYIVLLEDFVGSGTQCRDALNWAVQSFDLPILFVPLILCPKGEETLLDLEKTSCGKLTIRPIIKIPRSELLGPERKNTPAWPITEDLELLVDKISKDRGIRGPYGFKQCGCSVSTFSNTPNNSISIIHTSTGNPSWKPLFPRITRE